MSYLFKKKQDTFRKELNKAFNKPDYEEAKATIQVVRKKLVVINERAVRSLDEGIEEILSLHRLRVFEELSRSLETTNCIESVLAGVEQMTGKVDYWVNFRGKERWFSFLSFGY
jgi:transposase-like protein